MANPSPKVSVIVPTFNRENYIKDCIESLLSQTLAPHQILVANDGSTDHTRQILEPYFNQIQYFETPQLGKPGAINEMLKKVTGGYIWIFDDDDVALPDALQRFTEPLEAHPQYDYSFSSYYFTPTQKGTFALGEPASAYEIPKLEKSGPLIPILENNYLGGAALFTRASCYDKVGTFDTSLIRSQDYEMAIRIVRACKGVQIKGEPTFHYRQHDGMRGSVQDRFVSLRRSSKWLEYDQIFFRKLYQELTLQDYLPPGYPLQYEMRCALLQRMAMLAIKNMPVEFTQDLHILSELEYKFPLAYEEKVLIKKISEVSYYRQGSVLDNKAAVTTLGALSKRSPTIKALREELRRNSIRAATQKPKISNLIRALRLI